MDLQSALFLYIVIILSAIAHEYGHAWAALRQGDSTAKYAGRLTLNPVAHMELFGTVVLPLILMYFTGIFFGYAKPVPINPYNFRDQRRGMIWVSLAGVGANFLLAIILGVSSKFIPVEVGIKAAIINAIGNGHLSFSGSSDFIMNIFIFICIVVFINIQLGLFNLLPFPPLDGSKLALALAANSGSFSRWLALVENPFGVIIAIFVAMTFLPALSQFIFRLLVG